VAIPARDALAQLEATHAGHADVADDGIYRISIESLERGLGRRGPGDTEPALPEPGLQELADERIVVDDEDLADHPPRSLDAPVGRVRRHMRVNSPHEPSGRGVLASHRHIGRGSSVEAGPRAPLRRDGVPDV